MNIYTNIFQTFFFKRMVHMKIHMRIQIVDELDIQIESSAGIYSLFIFAMFQMLQLWQSFKAWIPCKTYFLKIWEHVQEKKHTNVKCVRKHFHGLAI